MGLDKPTWVGKGGEGLAGRTEVTQQGGGKYENLFRVGQDYEMSTYYVLNFFCTFAHLGNNYYLIRIKNILVAVFWRNDIFLP